MITTTPTQALAVAVVVLVAVGASVLVGLIAGIRYGRLQERRDFLAQAAFDTRMDEITGYDAAAARAEAYGLPRRAQPAEVYDHETEGL